MEAAWAEPHEAREAIGWYVGRPAYDERRDEWQTWAADMTEKAVMGHRSREWTAVAPTEEGVVRGMARCLREISDGRVPT